MQLQSRLLQINERFSLRFYARKDFVDGSRMALDNSVKFIKELEQYVNYKYELDFMHSAAIPDFPFRKKLIKVELILSLI